MTCMTMAFMMGCIVISYPNTPTHLDLHRLRWRRWSMCLYIDTLHRVVADAAITIPTLCDVLISCHIMSCHVMSCQVMLCHAMSCPLKRRKFQLFSTHTITTKSQQHHNNITLITTSSHHYIGHHSTSQIPPNPHHEPI